MKRDYLYIPSIAILIIILFIQDKCNDKAQAKLRNEIAKQSGIIQEREGVASQLVTIVNNQRQLQNEFQATVEGFRNDWGDIKKTLKQNNERILQFSTAYLGIAPKKDTVIIYPMDSASAAQWKFTLLYPDSLKPFIKYDGLIFAQTRNIIGNWSSPNSLPITAVLTETSKGVWKSRLIAPEWITVDSIQVRSLPPDKIAERRRFGIVAGISGGYNIQQQDPVFGLAFGARIKAMRFLIWGDTQSSVQLQMTRDF